MGWDYYTFYNQPDFFIDMIYAFVAAEKKAAKIRSKNK